MSLVKVTLKNGKVISVLPEEVSGLKGAGLLKEEKEVGKTKEEKSTGQTKAKEPEPPKPRTIKGTVKRPVNISHANIKGARPKKT